MAALRILRSHDQTNGAYLFAACEVIALADSRVRTGEGGELRANPRSERVRDNPDTD